MKLVPIAIATLLACGSALAQVPDAAQRAENREKAGDVAEKGVDGAKRAVNATERGVKRAANATERGVKRAARATGNVASKAASKVRGTGEAIARQLPPAPDGRGTSNDAGSRTAMGASSADAGADGNRRQRMDDAYGNWQRQSGNR